MKFKPQLPHTEAANSSDLPTVLVCFQDREIGELFAALLSTRGVTPILTDTAVTSGNKTKIVTEPCFIPDLTVEQMKHCLIVGPKKSLKNVSARSLEQPLTEENVESALDYLSSPLRN